MRFKNRAEAGRLLGAILKNHVHKPAIVYALPRGGVPVAIEVARALDLPMDLVIPRKLGHPWQPEYAIGAVTETGEPVCNEDELRHVDREWFKAKVAAERAEAHRRRALYCGGRPRMSARDQCAVLVDDGVATGLTLQAAVQEVRADHPARLIVAVGVAPADTAERFRTLVDDFVAVQIPEYFQGAVGAYFEDFHQLSDDDMLDAMKTLRANTGGDSR
ncbi:phosphoribosyltransferase family protein [Fontimonas sp. SYSU GA230001]|uniref:phosphoribosyltransferase n=1 Tax=Fontimonas sp. SYSU GA230001 TaxID=3142450 RepID=UPI0032B44360